MTGSAKQSRGGEFRLDSSLTLLAMTAVRDELPLVVATSQSAAIRIRND
jgi:hypothetical protein